MAYADATQTNRKLGTGAAVLALEVALGWGLIVGLATSLEIKPQTRTTTFDVKSPEVTPIVKPVEPPKPIQTQTRTDTKPLDDRIFDTGPSVLPTFTADDGGGVIREVIFTPPVTPTPPPPRFTPKAARAKGNMAGWVGENDYPTSDLRAGHEGRTAYRLSIDTSGKVTNCTVTASSGWPGLDKTTCDKLTSRGKFEPATNSDGERVAGTFSSAVSWRIPDE
ncbi:MAG: TonB family protein [Sphingomonadales bacterium]|nr:TonB family protein [Sphingomonadales bacterium]